MIRRGDRRPFYAPAKYVVELRPEDIELAAVTAEVASSQRGHPVSRHFNGFTAVGPRKSGPSGPGSQFSTFQNVKKRIPTSAKSVEHLLVTAKPPGTAEKAVEKAEGTGSLRAHQTPSNLKQKAGIFESPLKDDKDEGKTAEFRVKPISRFQDRYRSNSLDSMLVSENHQVFKKKVSGEEVGTMLNARHSSTTVFHLHPAQHHLIPKNSNQTSLLLTPLPFSSPSPSTSSDLKLGMIQKRPTFEGLDKRKSWSIDTTR